MNNVANRIKDRLLYRIMAQISTIYNKCVFKLNGYAYGNNFRCNGRVLVRGREGMIKVGCICPWRSMSSYLL